MSFMPDIPPDRPENSYPVCKNCVGKGRNPKKRKEKCPECKGIGRDRSTCGLCRKDVKECLCRFVRETGAYVGQEGSEEVRKRRAENNGYLDGEEKYQDLRNKGIIE